MLLFQRFKGLAGIALAMLLVCSVLLPGLTAQAEAPVSYSAQLNMKVDGQDLTAKLCADLENQVFSAQGEIAGDGQILAQLGLFFSDSAFALQDSLLLGGTYGIDLSRLAENLPGSVFAPDSGSILALDQQLYDALLGANETEDAAIGIIGGADGPTSILVTGDLPSIIMKSVSTKVAPGELVLDEGTIKTTETTLTLDAKGMVKLAGELLTRIKEDAQARAALEELLAQLPLGSDQQKTADDLLADLDGTLASLEDTLTQAGACFTAVAAVDRQTKEPVSLSAAWTYGGKTVDVQAILAEGAYSLVRSDGSGQSLTLALKVEENTEDAFALRFSASQGGEETSSLRFHWDKKAGTYDLTVQNGEETDELAGTVQTSDNALVITADAANGQALEGFSLTLRRDDPTTLPQFRDITAMSEEEILQLLHTLLGEAA